MSACYQLADRNQLLSDYQQTINFNYIQQAFIYEQNSVRIRTQ